MRPRVTADTLPGLWAICHTASPHLLLRKMITTMFFTAGVLEQLFGNRYVAEGDIKK